LGSHRPGGAVNRFNPRRGQAWLFGPKQRVFIHATGRIVGIFSAAEPTAGGRAGREPAKNHLGPGRPHTELGGGGRGWVLWGRRPFLLDGEEGCGDGERGEKWEEGFHRKKTDTKGIPGGPRRKKQGVQKAQNLNFGARGGLSAI